MHAGLHQLLCDSLDIRSRGLPFPVGWGQLLAFYESGRTACQFILLDAPSYATIYNTSIYFMARHCATMGLDGARVNTLRELTLYLLFGLHSNFHLKDGDPTSSACCYLWSIHMFIPGPPKGASSTIFSLLTVHSSLSRVVQLYLGILVVMPTTMPTTMPRRTKVPVLNLVGARIPWYPDTTTAEVRSK